MCTARVHEVEGRRLKHKLKEGDVIWFNDAGRREIAVIDKVATTGQQVIILRIERRCYTWSTAPCNLEFPAEHEVAEMRKRADAKIKRLFDTSLQMSL